MRTVQAMPVFVAVLAVEDVVPFNLGIPGQVFGAPASVLGDRYQHSVCAPGGRVRTSGGLVLQTEHGLDLLQRADLIILPGTDPITTEVPDEVLDSLRAAHGRGARLVTLCTGAFILAATGLLDGRQAATHWFYASELAARHPAIDVRPEVLFIDDGQLLTSAGLAAGIDLCLHIVRADHGAEVANRCARYLVAAPHRPGGQSQYIERPVSPALLNPLAATQAWLLDHLDRDVTINQMAGHAGMSRRSFTRRFRVAPRPADHAGPTPAGDHRPQRRPGGRGVRHEDRTDAAAPLPSGDRNHPDGLPPDVQPSPGHAAGLTGATIAARRTRTLATGPWRAPRRDHEPARASSRSSTWRAMS